jgi:hypothetical protein
LNLASSLSFIQTKPKEKDEVALELLSDSIDTCAICPAFSSNVMRLSKAST